MGGTGAARAVLLVLDALGPEFVEPGGMPWLARIADRGAMAPLGGLAELVASTGPCHATLLTGAPLGAHGVLANRVFAPDGTVDSDPRVALPTILDRARDHGVPAAICVSDPDILSTVNARGADFAWPRTADRERICSPPPKYMPDDVTAEALQRAIMSGHRLIVGQLQAVDTAVHAHGIDAVETRAARKRIDDIVGALAAALERDWRDTLFMIVSDHRAENIVDRRPVRLAAEMAGMADVIEDGSAAVVRPREGKLAVVLERTCALEGVTGMSPLDNRHLVAWCEPGRAFGREGSVKMAACHGNLTTRPCVAVVAGGHPALESAAAEVLRAPPSQRLWPRLCADVLGV